MLQGQTTLLCITFPFLIFCPKIDLVTIYSTQRRYDYNVMLIQFGIRPIELLNKYAKSYIAAQQTNLYSGSLHHSRQ